MTFEKIKERYEKNYITDAQLVRFQELGIIFQEQYDELYGLKHQTVEETEEVVEE